MTYKEKYPQVFAELEATSKSKIVVLSQDDLLTLKLLRDEFKSTFFRNKDDPNRNIAYYTEQRRLLETLERILIQ